MDEQWVLFALAARSLGVTALAAAGAGALALVSRGGSLPFGLAPTLAPVLALLGLVAYFWELRQRHIWAAVRSALLDQDSLTGKAEDWTNAAPLIDFQVLGAGRRARIPYPIVEWRDETRWTNFGFDVDQGILLVSFPLEFIPGDFAEATALEHARAQVASPKLGRDDTGGACEREALCGCRAVDADAAALESGGCLRGGGAEVLLRLRLPDGREVEALPPVLVDSRPAGPRAPCPAASILCCACGLGLLADLALVGCLARRVEWPVRKRFFTAAGGRLGTVRFTCADGCSVAADGRPEELRSKNGFWIGTDEKWQLLQAEVAQLAPRLVALRRLRLAGQCAAVVTALAVFASSAVSGGASAAGQMRAFLAGAVGASLLWALATVADRVAEHRVQACAERLGRALPGGATVTATWPGGTLSSCLSLEVEQEKPLRADLTLPVLKSGTPGASVPW